MIITAVRSEQTENVPLIIPCFSRRSFWEDFRGDDKNFEGYLSPDCAYHPFFDIPLNGYPPLLKTTIEYEYTKEIYKYIHTPNGLKEMCLGTKPAIQLLEIGFYLTAVHRKQPIGRFAIKEPDVLEFRFVKIHEIKTMKNQN